MTNYAKILKLLKSEVQDVLDEQPELERSEVLEDILEGIKADMDNESVDDEDDNGEEFID
jgi:hypothetical protein